MVDVKRCDPGAVRPVLAGGGFDDVDDPMDSVNSSNISTIDYDSDSESLTITFRSGASYLYRGVPPEVYEGLKYASSPGRYFQTAIKSAYSGIRIG
jgi:KTSC domain